MSDNSAHWDRVYQTKQPTEVSWYEETPAHSLGLIRSLAEKTSRIIDVGAGQSTLVDELLAAGYTHLTVLDVSTTAIDATQKRLGDKAKQVKWLVADITQAPLLERYDIWHDRALLHFLTAEADRQKYVELLKQSLVAGGYFIVNTFVIGGPDRCSGLICQQYDSKTMRQLLGNAFEEVFSNEVAHITPAGKTQIFSRGVYKKLE